MAFLYNHTVRKILLTLILLWGSLYFYLANTDNILLLSLLGSISVFTLVLIWFESSAIVILLFLSFIASYAFYISLFQYELPLSLVMVGILLVFGYLFTYYEQKIGILGNKRLIYLVLFSLIILEVFLSLSYFLINPISQSLVIATCSYFFVGYCYTILAKHTDSKLSTYILLTVLIMAGIFLSSRWGGLV